MNNQKKDNNKGTKMHGFFGLEQVDRCKHSLTESGQKHWKHQLMTYCVHRPAGIALTSDWCVNNFTMVVCEKFLSSSLRICFEIMTKNKILIDNHYKTIYEPVRNEYF